MSRVFRGIGLNGYRILGDDHNQKVAFARSCGKDQKAALIAEPNSCSTTTTIRASVLIRLAQTMEVVHQSLTWCTKPSALRYLGPAETSSRAYADWE
jgi:hypothetical protein